MKKTFIFELLCIIFVLKRALGQTIFSFSNDVTLRFYNRGTHTEIVITSPLGNGVNPNSAWIGIGFGPRRSMVFLMNCQS